MGNLAESRDVGARQPAIVAYNLHIDGPHSALTHRPSLPSIRQRLNGVQL